MTTAPRTTRPMINRLPKEFRLPTPNGVKHAVNGNAASRLGDRVVASTARCIGEHPIAALGLALLAGLVAGRIVKR